MKDWWKYILVGLVVFLAAYAIALLVFGAGWGRVWLVERGMMRPGMMPGMMRGFFSPHLGVFGWLGMLGRLLIPILLLVLAALGLAALLRGSSRTPLTAAACPNCRRSIQTGWVACPYCGQDLRPSEPTPPASTT